ncbi:MAG: alcohol dehydrogenase catalytic domain-containing protein [Acidimicrobiales bacterium]|nr:alcohol dehydrogenase catalytic domain-containing protein [Acidimicrobiales bacterium]
MHAAVLQEPGQPLAVVEVDDPTPAADEVLLAVEACGICGSDLHVSDVLPAPGLIMGHELCGTVVAVGGQVRSEAPLLGEGVRVAALSLATCGRCIACRTGRVRKCVEAKMIGIERPGGYAELITIPARDVVPLPEGLDHRHGALIEPLAVGIHTVNRAGIAFGDDVLVLGGGPIGVGVAIWLTQAGAREVIVSDPVASRRELAMTVGATGTLDPMREDVATGFAAITGSPPRHVIECVGIPGLLQHAVDVAATDATITVAGVCVSPDQIVPWTFMAKETDVRFSFYYTAHEFNTVIDMINLGRIDPLPLITDEISLDEVPSRFQTLKQPTDHCKVLIRP